MKQILLIFALCLFHVSVRANSNEQIQYGYLKYQHIDALSVEVISFHPDAYYNKDGSIDETKTFVGTVTIPDTLPDGSYVTHIHDTAFVEYGYLINEITIPKHLSHYPKLNALTKLGGMHWRPDLCDNYDTDEYNGNLLGLSTTSLQQFKFYGTCVPSALCAELPNLLSITSAGNITTIGTYAYYHSGLPSISLGKSLDYLGKYALAECKKLQSVTFFHPLASTSTQQSPLRKPTTSVLITLPTGICRNSDNLTQVTIEEGWEVIEASAFEGCSSLPEIVLPSTVDSLGVDVFKGCISLARIICYATEPPAIDSTSFTNGHREIPVYVPEESIEAYKNDSIWTEFNIQSVEDLPDGVESIPAEESHPATKVLEQGILYILHENDKYNIQGQLIETK